MGRGATGHRFTRAKREFDKPTEQLQEHELSVTVVVGPLASAAAFEWLARRATART